MNIFLTTLCVQPLVLLTLYLYASGVFINRRAFQLTFFVISYGPASHYLSGSPFDFIPQVTTFRHRPWKY